MMTQDDTMTLCMALVCMALCFTIMFAVWDVVVLRRILLAMGAFWLLPIHEVVP